MRTRIKASSNFDIDVTENGIEVKSHGDRMTFYVPLTSVQRRSLAVALTADQGTDPAVHVVRESDIAAVEVKHQAGCWVVEDVRNWGDLIPAEAARNENRHLARQFAANEAVARAIEAEQAVDPVEAKARELCSEAFPNHDWGNAPWDIEDHWRPIEDGFRRLARHQIRREADQ